MRTTPGTGGSSVTCFDRPTFFRPASPYHRAPMPFRTSTRRRVAGPWLGAPPPPPPPPAARGAVARLAARPAAAPRQPTSRAGGGRHRDRPAHAAGLGAERRDL